MCFFLVAEALLTFTVFCLSQISYNERKSDYLILPVRKDREGKMLGSDAND